MESAAFVVALSPFLNDSFERYADVVLPMGTFAETSGTFVNAAGDWQSFEEVAESFGESRPAWKILRVLGNLLSMPDCDYETSQDICDEIKCLSADVRPDNGIRLDETPATAAAESVAPEDLDVPMYRIDPLVRRAHSLQRTRDGLKAAAGADADRKIA